MIKEREKAVADLWNGRIDDAIAALNSMPESADVENDLGVALYFKGERKEAVSRFERALKLDPHHGAALVNAKYVPAAVDVAPSTFKIVEDSGPPAGAAPSVSVIMPHYNRAEFMEEALQSIMNQTRGDFEIVLVNDGGTRDCEKIIDRVGRAKIRYIYIEHAGQSVAMNAGLTRARGKYVAYLDDDDIFYPDHIETLAGYLDAHPEAKVAYAHTDRAEQEFIDGVWKVVDRRPLLREPYDRQKLLRSNKIAAPLTLMHHRSIIDEIGGLNEALMAAKDWDFWIRMSAKYEFHRIDKITSEHRIRKSGATQITSNVRRQRYYDNIIVFIHRITPIASAMPGNEGYAKAMRKIGELAAAFPEVLEIIDLRYFKDRPAKIYPLFFDMAKGLAAEGRRDAASKLFATAASFAPFEPRIYINWCKLFFGAGA